MRFIDFATKAGETPAFPEAVPIHSSSGNRERWRELFIPSLPLP